MEQQIDIEKKYKKLIIAVSIVIPVAVGALFGIKIEGVDTSFLPPIYASINAITAACLIMALIAVKSKKIGTHEKLMKLCLVLSCIFLVAYVAYHMTSESAKYHGEYKFIYYPILVSHILLSVGIIPLILIAFVKALAKRFDKHKKIARFAYPLWLYVAISGVVVYLMISPYYQ